MRLKRAIFIAFVFGILFFLSQTAEAAVLTLQPSGGSFVVGSTFDVSIFLDTEGQSINVIDVGLIFPPDKIQVISPTTGKSIIGVWTAQPRFNNEAGIITLQGGVPGGINVSQGLIATLTFRVKQVGTAILKFSDNSRILLNDGKGTDVLKEAHSAFYNLILPPPVGPTVISQTHPDQSKWYSNPTVLISWTNSQPVEGYSYVLNSDPIDLPDDISEGLKTAVVYKNLTDGTHYFHIKALREGAWGGVSHFAVNVDTAPPALFKIEFSPSARTTSRNPVLKFQTTDAHSGIDHYEYKIVSLKPESEKDSLQFQPFFVEATSPRILSLAPGDYDIIVRAYDKAGNFREVTERLEILTPYLRFISERGVVIGEAITIPWLWALPIILFIILILGYGATRIYAWHLGINLKRINKELPPHIKEQLDALKKYRERYGKLMTFLIISSAILVSVFGAPYGVTAQVVEISPPFISTVSRNISNEEIFYIGGKTDAANMEVIIYLQNLQTGETVSQNVVSNKKGDWFYRHPSFLSSGNYLLWAQAKVGDQLSPPTPQILMKVRPTAIQFGASRLSFETLYLLIAILLFAIVLGLGGFIFYHWRSGRRKHALFMKEIREAEESLRRGFAVLRRDIEAELALVRKAKLEKSLLAEERAREAQLLKDLEEVQKYIGQEIWDIEELEHTD
jgi:hypothetical protein